MRDTAESIGLSRQSELASPFVVFFGASVDGADVVDPDVGGDVFSLLSPGVPPPLRESVR
jgi:hypothetical protein